MRNILNNLIFISLILLSVVEHRKAKMLEQRYSGAMSTLKGETSYCNAIAAENAQIQWKLAEYSTRLDATERQCKLPLIGLP